MLYLICRPSKRARKQKIISLCREVIGRKIVIRAELWIAKEITYMHVYKIRYLNSKNDGFQSKLLRPTWHHNIYIYIYIWTKLVVDTMRTVITTKYQKYISTTIHKHANVLAKVNKSPYVRLFNMKPHGAYSITIHVHTMTILDISHKQKE